MPINSYIYIFETCSFLAIIGLIINRKHLLIALLYLEAIILSLVIAIPLLLVSVTSQSIFISIILLSVGACEASLGLAIMVIISRTYGSDLIRSTTINKC
jgi:NADH:ubiquinone oxidoreductase subunit K